MFPHSNEKEFQKILKNFDNEEDYYRLVNKFISTIYSKKNEEAEIDAQETSSIKKKNKSKQRKTNKKD